MKGLVNEIPQGWQKIGSLLGSINNESGQLKNCEEMGECLIKSVQIPRMLRAVEFIDSDQKFE